MKRSDIIRPVSAALGLSLLACAGPNSTGANSDAPKNDAADMGAAAQDADAPLNVLFIAVDDLNVWPGAWDGPAVTPNIDALAASGVQFFHAYAASPACAPSRAALMTGQRPERTGAYLNEDHFRTLPNAADLETLPQRLMREGYETVASGKIFHHPRGTGEAPAPRSDPASWTYQSRTRIGTDGREAYWDENNNAAWLGGDAAFEGVPINAYIRKEGIWGPIDQPKEETGDFETARFCADYLREAHDKPFLLACGIFRPHSPQLAPQEFFDLYDPAEIAIPDLPPDDMADLPDIAQANWSTSFTRRLKTDPEEWKRAVHGYLASVSFADAAIGEILRGLADGPYADNTVVVLYGDHGFQLGHKDRWEKFTMWRMGAQTPMIIRAPGVAPGVARDPVSLIDIYPTVLDLLGLETDQTLDGNSLAPLMADPGQDWPHPTIITYQQDNVGVMDDHWNFIQYMDGSRELYDHRTDYDEWNNLLADDPDAYSEVVDELAAHLPEIITPQPRYKPGG